MLDSELTWHKLEIGENNLHFRKILFQIAKKKGIPAKSSRVGRGKCLIQFQCTEYNLALLETEATAKLKEKQEKWKLRGLLPPEEASWQRFEVAEEEKELRDLVVKRARSKRFRARTGSSDNKLFVEVLCHPEQMVQLKESAEEILREREWDNNLDNPNYSLYKRLSANPLKTDEEVEAEELEFLKTLVQDLQGALLLFASNKDDHYYDVNVAARSLHQEIQNLVNEGLTVTVDLKGIGKRMLRWIGQRNNMLYFKFSGEPHPYVWTVIDSISLADIQTITI